MITHLQKIVVKEKARIEIHNSLTQIVKDTQYERGLSPNDIIRIFVEEAKKLDSV